MGIVYLAQDPRAGNRVVALKVLPFAFSHDESLVRRFRREAEAVKRLRHPHIIRIYESGESDDASFIAMEYIDGGSLHDRMRSGRPSDWNTVTRVMNQVASALDYAHRRGIIHRDIKPSNILMARDGRAILTDFGLAKLPDASWLTGSSDVMGTPHYMAPEQVQGTRDVDYRCDIYALGVVCYQMLTGRVPFDRPTSPAVLHAHVYEPTPPPSQYNRRITPQVEEVVLHALEKQPETRYQTASSFAADLRTGTLSPEARTRARVSRASMKDASRTPKPAARTRARKWDLGRVGLAAVALIVVVLATVAVLNGRDQRRPRPPTVVAAATVSPGTYSIDREFTQTTSYDIEGQRGTYTAAITLDRIDVSKKDMTFYLTEVFTYSDPGQGVRVNKDSDVDNRLVYVTDNLGNRYDQAAAGGDFARAVTMEHNVPASGWFKFPPPKPGARTFTFRMDDQHVVIENIVLK